MKFKTQPKVRRKETFQPFDDFFIQEKQRWKIQLAQVHSHSASCGKNTDYNKSADSMSSSNALDQLSCSNFMNLNYSENGPLLVAVIGELLTLFFWVEEMPKLQNQIKRDVSG